MSYTWTNGELITAEKLNQTGGKLTINVTRGTGDYAYHFIMDKTGEEIYTAFSNGTPCIVKADIDPIESYYPEGVHEIDMVLFIETKTQEDNSYYNITCSGLAFDTFNDNYSEYPTYYFGD